MKIIRCKTPHDIILVDSPDLAEDLSRVKPNCGHPHAIIVSDTVEFFTPSVEGLKEMQRRYDLLNGETKNDN